MNKNHKFTRRDFLKTSIASLAAFTIVPRHVLGGPGFTPPSEVLTRAVIGTGGMGMGHVTNINTACKLLAVCDVDEKHLATAVKAGGADVKGYRDFREVLARKDIDIVHVPTPPHWHALISIAAAKAGKDVYCQKPLALDYSLTKMLRDVIKDKKRIFQFGTQYRSQGPNGRYRRMVQLVRNGYIGQLQRIDLWSRDLSVNVDQYHVKPYGSTTEVPVPADLDFDAWMGPSEMVPFTVDRVTNWGGYHCPETSLGFIAGCAIHELGLAQWGNKTDHTSPIRYAGTGTVPTEGVYRTLERWDVNCDYANGVKLRFMDCRTAKAAVAAGLGRNWRDGDGIIFHGSEGWISDAMGFCASNQELWKQEFKPTDEQLMISPEHNRNFIDCVKSRQETICPVEMAIRCDAIPQLANIAARTGRVIQWNPEKEEITGDADAAKMLTRPSREKWRIW